ELGKARQAGVRNAQSVELLVKFFQGLLHAVRFEEELVDLLGSQSNQCGHVFSSCYANNRVPARRLREFPSWNSDCRVAALLDVTRSLISAARCSRIWYRRHGTRPRRHA